MIGGWHTMLNNIWAIHRAGTERLRDRYVFC
jgi:hypothetical protein